MTRLVPCRLRFVLLCGLGVGVAGWPAVGQEAAQRVWKGGDGAPGAWPAVGTKLTLLLRLPDLKELGEVFRTGAADGGRTAVRAGLNDENGARRLVVELGFDAPPNPLRLVVPVAAIGAGEPHAVIVRLLGYRVELLVDGVLVDEDWPIGGLVAGPGPVVVRPGVEAQLWDRAVDDAAIVALSGGSEGLEARRERYLGPEHPVGSYWRPRGLNTFAGDCMPFYHDGRFHLFYLFDRRHHGSKWGLGAHQWAHVSSTDLVHWDTHPMAVGITDPMEGSICTGSVFFDGGVYRAFYTVRMADGTAAPLCAATSRDGIHFDKQPPLARLSAPYQGGGARDPVLFRDETTGLYHLVLTTSLAGPKAPGRSGCLAHLVSRDLEHWEQQEPFLVPGYPGEPECADHFAWNGWYYLVFSNQGVARYRMARSPLGPWTRPVVDTFDGAMASVMKTAAFTGNRRLGVAFLRSSGYAGNLVFRELVQHPDGRLGTRWVPEMAPGQGEAQMLPEVRVASAESLEEGVFPAVPGAFALKARVNPDSGSAAYGLRIGGDANGQGALEVRFEPQRRKVGLRAADAGSWDECEDVTIYEVEGLDRPFLLELVVAGDVVDLCVDGRRTLIGRRVAAGPRLAAFAFNGGVTFEAVEVRACPVAP